MTACGIAVLVLVATGLVAVPGRRWPRIAAVGAIAAAAIGIPAAAAVIADGTASELHVAWAAPIENVGVILLGLGIGSWAAYEQHPGLAALALCGGLLHLWNHVMMKGLMFLGAGSLLHATGTRDLERMGGLLHRMPRTGVLIVLGAVAIAGLPPLAGFTGEWLVYRGLIDGGLASNSGAGQVLWMLFAIAALAGVGVLAALCFVRIVGIALLGRARTEAAAHAHESSAGMIVPMTVLGGGIVAMPFVAPWLVAWFGPVISQIAHASVTTAAAAGALAPIAWLSLVLWAALAGGLLVMRWLAARAHSDDTWGCGYAAPTPRMQYTSGSFAESMLQLLPRALRARTAVRRDAVPFPRAGAMASDRDDPFTRSGYEPLFDRLGKRFAQLRWVQQGITHLYVLYIVVTVVGVLAAVAVHDWWMLP